LITAAGSAVTRTHSGAVGEWVRPVKGAAQKTIRRQMINAWLFISVLLLPRSAAVSGAIQQR
jgi:hypothetical protein